MSYSLSFDNHKRLLNMDLFSKAYSFDDFEKLRSSQKNQKNKNSFIISKGFRLG